LIGYLCAGIERQDQLEHAWRTRSRGVKGFEFLAPDIRTAYWRAHSFAFRHGYSADDTISLLQRVALLDAVLAI
jgi:hypothetical protein